MISLNAFLLIGAALFAAGLACILTRRNLIHILMGVELIFNGAALNFVAFSHYVPSRIPGLETSGQVVALFVIVLAAAEAAVALALVLSVFKVFKTVEVNQVKDLKG